MPHTPPPAIAQFISRWKASGASERTNYQLFLSELCELLGVENPRPASDKVHEATYTFERPVVFDDGEGKTSTNFIDLYKKDCFVLDAKQGSDKAYLSEAEMLGAERVKTKSGTASRDTRTWDREMKKAKEQALRYARSLPAIIDMHSRFVESQEGRKWMGELRHLAQVERVSISRRRPL
ncbi:hypothetical protein GCM10023188_43930 [Pontibacter saemangeumensis]|uniref:MmeI-like N-terminal domain-containing protein n=1 Tax=Pontibacter saemangeumensis TaxID=1084525 RepID=A0ABP8M4Y2_9BACT